MLSPTSGPTDLEITTARDVCAWSLLFCPVIAVHLGLLLKPPVLGLTHRELPQVSVVEKVTQLFPSTENMTTVPFPLMFCKKQPAVKSTKLRRSPDPAHDSWRASNVLCHHRQMDRSVTYTYNRPPPPSSQENIDVLLSDRKHGCFSCITHAQIIGPRQSAAISRFYDI